MTLMPKLIVCVENTRKNKISLCYIMIIYTMRLAKSNSIAHFDRKVIYYNDI